MRLLALVIVPLLAALNVLATTNQGTPCLAGCSKWSNTLKQCYSTFGQSPNIQGYNYSNQFLRCLCEGQHSENGTMAIWGNATMTQAAGICQSCSTTPKEIKADLSTYLTLCVIQLQNGTAANATTFAPRKYVTSDDPNVGIIGSGTNSQNSAVVTQPVLLAVGAAVFVGLATVV